MYMLDRTSQGRRLLFHKDGFNPRTFGLAFHQETTSAEDALGWLAHAAPQREFVFLVQQAGKTEPRLIMTHGQERPLWCFFPTRTGEWVLWRYLDYAYDASPGGDDFIGWQISGSPDQTPAFYPAREFDGRRQFYRPDKIDEVLASARVRPEHISISAIEPPEVTIRVARPESAKGITVELAATPRGPRDYHRPKTVTLWVNDYRYQVWPAPPAELGEKFAETVLIPADRLPVGPSRLTIQCESRAGTTVKCQITVQHPGPPPARRLYALLVGIANYRSVKMKSGRPPESLPGVLIDLDEIGELLRAAGRPAPATRTVRSKRSLSRLWRTTGRRRRISSPPSIGSPRQHGPTIWSCSTSPATAISRRSGRPARSCSSAPRSTNGSPARPA